ncbi:MAG: hypothetical protein M1840_007165 [Geoglossum simile]|nr:MAG: hypothetical protein M1840_007165 [Geoglossum simile]
MAPKITPKPQPRRRQADPGNEKPAADGAPSSATAAQVPSPLRPAVTRLESIAGGPPILGTAKAPLKYKPTGIARRTKEEREKAEREEQERLAARAVTTPSETGAGRGGEGANRRARGDTRGGMRGRGRGGALGGDRPQGAASGPFAIASAAMGQKRYFTEGPRGGIASSSPTSHARDRVKVEQGATPGQSGSVSVVGIPNIKAEIDELYKSSSDGEDVNEGERMNIELINLSNNQEMYGQSGSKDKGREGGPPDGGAWGSLFPIRIDRKEHIERTAGTGAEEGMRLSSRADRDREKGLDDGLFVSQDDEWERIGSGDRGKDKDLDFVKNERKWRGVYDDDDVEVKSEFTDTDPMAIDAPILLEDAEMTDATELPVPSSSKPLDETDKPLRRLGTPEEPKKSSYRRDKPVIQIDEDRAEWERHGADMRALAHELGNVEVAEPPTSGTVGGYGESVSAATSPAPPRDPKEGRLYLFQLPPIIPPLVPLIKPDPADLPAPPLPANQHQQQQAPIPPAAHPAAAAEGLIGRMRVHRSSRVTIEWGGSRLEIQKGSDWGFLTDVVATDDEAVGNDPIACGMGSVRANFVAVPEWRSLLR